MTFVSTNAASLIEKLLEQADYSIREVTPRSNEDAAYEVAKFSWRGKSPSAVYRITRIARQWRCDCPGFARVVASQANLHKHIKLVQAWLKAGRPDPLEPGFHLFVQKILGE